MNDDRIITLYERHLYAFSDRARQRLELAASLAPQAPPVPDMPEKVSLKPFYYWVAELECLHEDNEDLPVSDDVYKALTFLKSELVTYQAHNALRAIKELDFKPYNLAYSLGIDAPAKPGPRKQEIPEDPERDVAIALTVLHLRMEGHNKDDIYAALAQYHPHTKRDIQDCFTAHKKEAERLYRRLNPTCGNLNRIVQSSDDQSPANANTERYINQLHKMWPKSGH